MRGFAKRVDPERVLLGSDYPAVIGDNGQVAKIEQLGLSDDTVQKILGGTAAGLLGIGDR